MRGDKQHNQQPTRDFQPQQYDGQPADKQIIGFGAGKRCRLGGVFFQETGKAVAQPVNVPHEIALISGISDGIIMGTADVLKTSQVMPKAKIITVHMDTVNHTAVSRADMRKFIRGQGIESRVNVPEDGETVRLD